METIEDLRARLSAVEARCASLSEALQRIAAAGEGIPDWRAMANCARAALAALPVPEPRKTKLDYGPYDPAGITELLIENLPPVPEQRK